MLCCLFALVIFLGVLMYHVLTWMLTRMRVNDYASKHVLISGCDSGFGNRLTRRLEKLGFHVFAACLTPEGAKNLQSACSDRVTTLLLDVTSATSIADARQFVESKLPPGKGLWGLVNNAGVSGAPVPTEWLSEDDWSSVLSVNLMGVIQMTRAFLPLVRTARGRVVNVASMMGRFVAAPGPYCVSKYGVEAFSDCLRREVYTQGIKVCILEPGYFKTEIINVDSLVSSFRKKYDATPPTIRHHYTTMTDANFTKLMGMLRKMSSDRVDLVIDGFELALTSRFPPTRQLIGYDACYVYRLLWNLPTPVADWILFQLQQKARQ